MIPFSGSPGDLVGPPGTGGGTPTNPLPPPPSGGGSLGDLVSTPPGGGVPGIGDPSAPTPPETGYSLDDVMALMPGIPAELAQIVLDTWIETGSFDLGIARMRQSEAYETYFPGNRRADGSLRYDENTYYAIIEGFGNVVGDFGINPDLFAGGFVDMIRGGVGVAEFQARVDRLAERVLVQSEALRAHFAAEIGVELSTRALLAAMMDPNLNDALLGRQITEAEIMAEGTMRGFSTAEIDALDERLFERGFNRGTAGQLFGAAQEQLPLLNEMAQRHLDPDDGFSLGDFVEAMAFGDRFERLRIRRLFAAESAMWAPQLGIRQDPTGALTGLIER